VQHRNEIQLPFKRFQIQPVWRADRPQKGRYREFYQCDADVVGSDSLSNEIELLSLIDYVMGKLGINTCIHVNNRKILTGIAEKIGEADKIVDITVAIDKIDKIGIDNVNAELREKGLSEEAIGALRPLLELSGSNDEKLEKLSEILSCSETGMKGVEEMKVVLEGFENLGHTCGVELDVSLARGLNYYTGTIIEVKALDVEIGSISGGGRYDNLTGVFGVSGLSGVGISFGADRIYDVLNHLDLYPKEIAGSVKALFINFGKDEAAASMKCVKALRDSGISAELYPDCTKMKKQMQYANSEGVKYVVMIGDTELSEGTATVKNMADGVQVTVPQSKLSEVIC
ncbi:MAG: histidine--tRNA ligase, partial [Muribaculaceae bacterium]|nr:histidine--tRNA ligase [Muribaculaceae bacterium]